MRFCLALVFVVVVPSLLTADMGFPRPGINRVRCDVEIEVPAELNGYRLFLCFGRDKPRELLAGTTFRMSDHTDSRDSLGMLIAISPEVLKRMELDHMRASHGGGPTIQLWADLHFLDSRSTVHARYRIESVSPEGEIQVTTLHVDGGWTGYLCVTTCVLPILGLFGWMVWAIVRGGCWPRTSPGAAA